jgi:hypothetical protein
MLKLFDINKQEMFDMYVLTTLKEKTNMALTILKKICLVFCSCFCSLRVNVVTEAGS